MVDAMMRRMDGKTAVAAKKEGRCDAVNEVLKKHLKPEPEKVCYC